MLAGDGFGREGTLESSLPPGYPVLIAMVFAVADSIEVLRIVQICLSVLSCWLVYLAVRPVSNRWATIAMFGMALSPTLAHHSGVILSETFGTFLMSMLVWLLARLRQAPNWWNSSAVGFTSTALVLTSPGVVVLWGLLLLAMLAKYFRSYPVLLAGAGGVLLLMVPWQFHQIRATGHIVPAIYEFGEQEAHRWPGLKIWIRSWLLVQTENSAYHCYRPESGLSNFDHIPERAFANAAQRDELRAACEGFITGRLTSDDFDQAFQTIAQARIEADKLRYYVTLPACRTVMVWFWVDQVWPAQLSYFGHLTPGSFRADWNELGLKRAALRFGKGVFSTGVILLNGAYAILFMWLLWQGIKSRDPVALAIVLGVLAYTFGGAIMASHEWRRNLVFYPAMFYLAAFLPSSGNVGAKNSANVRPT